MGRKSHAQTLSIWANGLRVGTWRIPARGAVELQYDRSWKDSPAGRPLSLSLPFGVDDAPLRGERVQNYFDNLLPDSDAIRKRIASRFGTGSVDSFDLLRAMGRDCVGAVQLLEEDETPGNVQGIDATALRDKDIEQLLEQTVSSSAFGANVDEDDFRISLAGAQEKTALLRHKGKWLRPHGATPTTHILKLPLGLVGNRKIDLGTSVENEWLCLNILREFGLPVAQTDIHTFGRQKVLSVTRFDRQLHPDGNWYLRLPQEDFCQALGVPPHAKYEADGGPGVEHLARILRQSENAEADLRTLLTTQILFWMLAAPDGHAKNFSLHLLAGGLFRMTPLYDVMSIWPATGAGPNQFNWHRAKLAMAIKGKNRHYLMKDIQRRHFNAMAAKCFFTPSAEPIIERILEQTPAVIDKVAAALPRGFPGHVSDGILNGLRGSAKQLAGMAAG